MVNVIYNGKDATQLKQLQSGTKIRVYAVGNGQSLLLHEGYFRQLMDNCLLCIDEVKISEFPAKRVPVIGSAKIDIEYGNLEVAVIEKFKCEKREKTATELNF